MPNTYAETLAMKFAASGARRLILLCVKKRIKHRNRNKMLGICSARCSGHDLWATEKLCNYGDFPKYSWKVTIIPTTMKYTRAKFFAARRKAASLRIKLIA